MLCFLHVFDIANPENYSYSVIDAFNIINERLNTINIINEQLKHKTKFIEEACYTVAGQECFSLKHSRYVIGISSQFLQYVISRFAFFRAFPAASFS